LSNNKSNNESRTGYKLLWLIISTAIIGLGIYFAAPYYGAYSAKKDLEKIGVTFSEQKFIEKACEGDEGSVALFIKAGMNINLLAVPSKQDGVAKGALHCAALKANTSLAKALLNLGANANLEDDNSNTPLFYAARAGNINNGKYSSLDMVELLISHGAKINAVSDNGTPLIASISIHANDMMESLLKHGANAKLTTKDGTTPLIMLASSNYGSNQSNITEEIDSLIKAGAEIDAKNKAGNSALMAAITNRDKLIVEALLKLGANPSIENTQGQTPLALAINDPETFKLLLNSGADINVKLNGETLLSRAINNQNLQIIQILLANKKMDVNGKNAQGETPLYVAVSRNNILVAQQLLASGADVNSTNNYLETSLIRAVNSGNIELVKALIEWSANVNARDGKNNTALFYAQNRTNGFPTYAIPNGTMSQNSPQLQNMISARQWNETLMNQRNQALQAPSKPQNNPIVELLVKHGAHL
jgi:ankyrin repeat protein